MGELTKRRAARDLWISRGHVRAALVGAFLLSGVSFGLGYLTGSGNGPAEPARGWAEQGFAEQVPGEDLVGLLARVEANRAALGGVETLTFPDELGRAADDMPVGPMAPPEALVAPEIPQEPVSDVQTHIPGAPAVAPELPAPPIGAFTLEVATVGSLEAARALADALGGCAAGGEGCPPALEGLSAWVGASIVDGELLYTVSLGGFATESAAQEALEGVAVLPDTRDAKVQRIP